MAIVPFHTLHLLSGTVFLKLFKTQNLLFLSNLPPKFICFSFTTEQLVCLCVCVCVCVCVCYMCILVAIDKLCKALRSCERRGAVQILIIIIILVIIIFSFLLTSVCNMFDCY